MRPSNYTSICVLERETEIERHCERFRDRGKEGTLSIKTNRVTTRLITSLGNTRSTEEWSDIGRRGEGQNHS